MVDKSFLRMLEGYGSTLIEVYYWRPDYPDLLQTFSFQQDDVAPDFPSLKKFLAHWHMNVKARLHWVRYSHSTLIKPREIEFAKYVGRLH